MKSGYPIDIVLPWVDGSDPDWLAERAAYSSESAKTNVDNSSSRYRDMGTLRYLLRSIDKFMPWIRTIHFVTWGHLPGWLNPDVEGLHIVKHEEFIPSEYLPTFSSHTIELNMHRIQNLAEHFIYFNDDMIVNRPMDMKDFFIDSLPVDYAIETALHGKYSNSIAGVALHDMEIINQHFSKRCVQRKNPGKWFNLRYGRAGLKTLLMLPWAYFSEFSYNHGANAFLKETFENVWAKEPEVLNETCKHRFRMMNDVNQWLMRDWQLVSGRFSPKTPGDTKYCIITDDLSEIQRVIKEKKYKIICINDVSYIKLGNVERTYKELNSILESFFPNPSRFERNTRV